MPGPGTRQLPAFHFKSSLEIPRRYGRFLFESIVAICVSSILIGSSLVGSVRIACTIRNCSPIPIQIRILLLGMSTIAPLSTLLLHGRSHLDFRLLALEILRLHRRNEIDGKTPHVKGVHERNDPFHHRSGVVVLEITQHSERNGESEFNKNESEFDPEGASQDPVLAVVDSEALVLGADEDRRDDVGPTVDIISV